MLGWVQNSVASLPTTSRCFYGSATGMHANGLVGHIDARPTTTHAGTSPSPTTSPVIVPPVIGVPGVSPSPGGNNTLPANSTGSLMIRTAWYLGTRDMGGKCYKWNGTALEVDNSTTYGACLPPGAPPPGGLLWALPAATTCAPGHATPRIVSMEKCCALQSISWRNSAQCHIAGTCP